MASNLKRKAKAIVAVRNRKKREEEEKIALEARERLLIDRLLEKVTIPRGKDGTSGRDGTDAPTMDAILAEIIPLIPEPVHTTVVQEVNPTDMEVFIKGMLPEIDPSDRPAVEQITNEVTIDISDEKLEGMVTQEEFKKALRKIQDAITASQSGGGGIKELTNVIEVSVDTTISSSQLIANAINVVLVTVAGITLTLPEPDATKIVWVQQGYTGTGTFTVCKV